MSFLKISHLKYEYGNAFGAYPIESHITLKMWVEQLRAKMIKYLRNSLLIKYIRDLPQRELLYQGSDVKG